MEEVEVRVVPAAVAPAPGTDIAVVKATVEKKATHLPLDWQLPSEWMGWAQTRRPEVDPFLEGEKFANFWWAKSGKDGTKRNWQATWRNWILNAKASGHANWDNRISDTEIIAEAARRYDEKNPH